MSSTAALAVGLACDLPEQVAAPHATTIDWDLDPDVDVMPTSALDPTGLAEALAYEESLTRAHYPRRRSRR